ncbi:branched-chain amino acid aminotransferase [Amycolatopsis sp. NPDC004079]|uniref:branched-chain amino acid aminotransferase n=1 Tax=Amycolatopsis sp. NPDC004079 TaxID=3154549 RepID=UPI0033B8317B
MPGNPAAIALRPVARPLSEGERARRTRSTAFGTALTEHMVSIEWNTSDGWHDAMLVPYEQLRLDPATVGLHYGQIVFEGLKAYRLPDGSVAVFRPDAHAGRLRSSARRLMMPELPEELFLSAVDALVAHDHEWLPSDHSLSLYLRPLLFASERTLALRPAREYRFLLMAFVTEGYFGSARRPVRVWVTDEYSRVAPGGIGAAKYAGNYAASLRAQEEAERNQCDQVVWLDPVRRRCVEELGGMNLFFVYGTGAGARLVTPPLSGNLLPGITRDSLLRLAPALGLCAEEARLDIRDWRAGCESGQLTEVFACGTAAGVTPVCEVRGAHGSWTVGGGETAGPVTGALRDALLGVQRGGAPDDFSWRHEVVAARDVAASD